MCQYPEIEELQSNVLDEELLVALMNLVSSNLIQQGLGED